MEAVHRSLAPNPRDKANILSVLLFWWTIKLFKKGYNKILDVTDLFRPLTDDRSESLGDRLEKKWLEQIKKSTKPSLLKAMALTFWREFAVLGILTAFNDLIVRLAQPILLGHLLQYFRLDKTGTTNNYNALYYGGGMVLLTTISSLTFTQFTMNAFHNGMKLRVAACSIIYRKALRLSRTALGDTAPGKVVNLLSNDVSRFDLVSILIHSMWSAPLLSIIVGVILWNEIQWAGIVGIAVVFIVVPIQSYTGKLSSIFRFQTAIRTDERVRFMDEIISGVQVIKMYAWEIPFSKLINYARRVELNVVRKNSHVRALYMTFSLFTTRAAVFATMLTMALRSEEITAARIFVISSYFNVISWTMSQMFVRGFAEIAESLVALKRLQKFLEYDEQIIPNEPNLKEKFLTEFGMNGNANGNVNGNKPVIVNPELPSDVTLLLKNATARWISGSDKSDEKKLNTSKRNDNEKSYDNSNEYKAPTLSDISIECKRGQLIGVIGTVGAGKSSLLQIILKELPLESGSVSIQGKLSYACQEPWVFPATIRQNILFGLGMEKNHYDSVVRSCALIKDFEQFADGDKTIIGEKGSSLSGGQKARISLARAVYRDADIYLFDDPLSAVDAHVGKHLFDEVIGPYGRLARRSATRVLVTHQIHFLKEADWIVILNDGKIEIQGTANDLAKSGIDLAEFLEEDVNDDSKELVENLSGKRSRHTSRSSSKSISSSKSSLNKDADDENEAENNENADEPETLEASSKGKVKGSIAGNYMKASGSLFFTGLVILGFVVTQIIVSAADYWVSFWTLQEEKRAYYRNHNATENVTVIDLKTFDKDMNYIARFNENYNKEMNTTPLNQTEHVVSNHHESVYLLGTDLCIYIHGGLVIAIFVIGIARSVGFYTLAIRASQNLHNKMFKGLISAPMRFFDTNPSGRILNRFSKDMGSIDELLPKAILDASQIILSMVGAVILSSVVKPIFLVPVVVLGSIFMMIRKVYLKTSKNIKRLEGATRSPVFTHLSASLSGLSTIRAFGAQNELIKEFDAHQDLHSGSWYMFISTASAFGLSLDILCLLFMASIVFYFLLLDKSSTGDEVGLAITQVLSLTGLLQWGIRQSAEIANQLMSVERVLEYRDLESEKEPEKPKEIAKTWPFEGKIEFKNVFYRYFEGAEPVLKGLNFVVNPQEKIGIVGRTGAGKSSLIGAIFRLAKVEGDILIDEVNTASILLYDIRSKVSIIPQDPVLFSGTLRRNLDPFEEYPDSEIWRALEAVELKEIAGGALGLQTAVMAGGSNFSVGQRQLVCLARAILRSNKILVLDEATANVDPHTDALIQLTIRSRFANCTVLTIAHRLHTIMDSDRVIVMNLGILAEFDTPYNLLQIQNGIFKDMVHATGQQESERLYELAKNKHESNQKVS